MNKEMISTLLSIVAICISLATIFVTRTNLKRQLRLGKLEEILEIIHFMKGYYPDLHRVFIGIERSIQELTKSNIISDNLKEAIKYQKGFIETITKEDLTSNAYLPNHKRIDNLKNRIHTAGIVYYHMYVFICLDGDPSIIKKTKDAIIPNPKDFLGFLTDLEKDIIKEMKLGYERMDEKSQAEYFATKFKKDLEQTTPPLTCP